jgi:tRNA dimethylallyltransferase
LEKPLIILIGPTAVGKTDVSIMLAKAINGEIISADSMLVYKYMDIGTAKPTLKEMDGVKHHLIDVVYPDDDFSVAVFKELAEKHIDEIISRGKLPMVVGGTGLYINSLIYNLNFSDTVSDPEYREYLNGLAEKHGNSYVRDMLKAVDMESYNRLHENNLRRVIRALEIYKQTGKPMSEAPKNSTDFSTDYEISMIGLNMNRQLLYDRVNSRVDEMLKNGLVDEVKMLLDMGYKRSLTSMQGLGYKEIASYIYGEYTFEEAVYKLKQNTRHFAKRQLTWFRREERINWIDVNSFNNREDLVKNIRCQIAGILNKI